MKRVVLHTGTISEVKAATRDDHLFVPLADLRVWALKHKATLHEIDTRPWDDCGCEVCQRSLASHAEALREIEEIIRNEHILRPMGNFRAGG